MPDLGQDVGQRHGEAAGRPRPAALGIGAGRVAEAGVEAVRLFLRAPLLRGDRALAGFQIARPGGGCGFLRGLLHQGASATPVPCAAKPGSHATATGRGPQADVTASPRHCIDIACARGDALPGARAVTLALEHRARAQADVTASPRHCIDIACARGDALSARAPSHWPSNNYIQVRNQDAGDRHGTHATYNLYSARSVPLAQVDGDIVTVFRTAGGAGRFVPGAAGRRRVADRGLRPHRRIAGAGDARGPADPQGAGVEPAGGRRAGAAEELRAQGTTRPRPRSGSGGAAGGRQLRHRPPCRWCMAPGCNPARTWT